MKKMVAILICAFVVFALMSSNLRAETRKYLKIGGDPHPAVAGKLLEGEKEFSLPKDLQVLTVGGSGYDYIGWLHTGEILIVKGDRIVRIKKCGNPVYFSDGKTINMEDFQTAALSTPQQEDMFEYAEAPDQPQPRQIVVQRNSSSQNFFSGILGAVEPSAMVVSGVHTRNGDSESALAWGIGSVLVHFLTKGNFDARYAGESIGRFGTGYIGGSTKTKTRNRVVYIHSDPVDPGTLPPF